MDSTLVRILLGALCLVAAAAIAAWRLRQGGPLTQRMLPLTLAGAIATVGAALMTGVPVVLALAGLALALGYVAGLVRDWQGDDAALDDQRMRDVLDRLRRPRQPPT